MIAITGMTIRCAGPRTARVITLSSSAITPATWKRDGYGKTAIAQTPKICRAIEMTTTDGLRGWAIAMITVALTAVASSQGSGTRRHRARRATTRMTLRERWVQTRTM